MKRQTIIITEDQVNHCKDFIKNQMIQTPSIRTKFSSYELKHAVEWYLQQSGISYYIPEAAFIAAISELGIPSRWAGTGDSIHVALKPKPGVVWKKI